MDDLFPDPGPTGVRIYAETENVVYGWIDNDAAIGHGYTGAVKQPKGTRYILSSLAQEKPQVCWCAYTQVEMADDSRQVEVSKIVDAMIRAANSPR
jgi:hypothetical protein